jgi:hypothetical protein
VLILIAEVLMITLPLRSLSLRLIFLLVLLAGLAGISWFIVRALIGNSFMTFAQRKIDLETPLRLSGADSAVRFASRDPLIHYQRGQLYLNAAMESGEEEKLAIAVAEMRAAAEMSPEDYRIWVGLGRALERSGAQLEARQALERAVRLAPRHFEPHWALGNLLLRSGEQEAAFAELRVALAIHPPTLPLVFDSAWNEFNGDAQAVARVLSPVAESRAQLASLLISRNRIVEGLAVWREIAHPTEAELSLITDALLGARQYRAAYEVWSSSPAAKLSPPDEGSLLSNGGFEREIRLEAAGPFLSWQIRLDKGIGASLDGQERRSGTYSLRLDFGLSDNPGMVIAMQTVPVAPTTTYQLSFTAKTQGLRSLSAPFIAVADVVSNDRLRVTSAPLPLGDSDWQDYTVKFTTPSWTEAVVVRIQCDRCADSPCPLLGRVWFDDFKLSPSL